MRKASLQWGKNRGPIPARIKEARKQRILDLLFQGATQVQMSEQTTLTVATVRNTVFLLTDSGEYIPSPGRARPKRQVFWRDLNHPKTIDLIRAYKARETLELISQRYSVTRECVRQWLNKIQKVHGPEVFAVQDGEVTGVCFSEAASILNISPPGLRSICEEFGVSILQRPGSTSRHYLQSQAFVRLQEIVAGKLSAACAVCGKAFVHESLAQTICSPACRKTAIRKDNKLRYGQRKRGEQDASRMALTPCNQEVLDRIIVAKSNTDFDQTLLLHADALGLAKVTPMVLCYLSQIHVLSVSEHPIAKCRRRPARAYLKGEIEILRDVYAKDVPVSNL